MQNDLPITGDTVAILHTNLGDIKIKLFPELTPLTFKNFTTHSKNGYYNSTTFHRVINNFMIQGGDPTGTCMGGESIYGDEFEDEFSSLRHIKGALSMANSGRNSNGSQFFIVQAKNGVSTLDGRHAVFGQVYEGIEVVDKIAMSKVDRDDKPLDDVVVSNIEIIVL